MLFHLGNTILHIYKSGILAMKKEVKNYKEVLEILKTFSVEWKTTNKIQNSLWVNGIAFFDRNYCRVAFYDAAHNHLVIH